MSSDRDMGRSVGGSEYSWCKAVPGGTGIAVLALLLSKPPKISRLQTALQKLQNDHPILNSTLHYSNTFSFLSSPTPILKLQSYDLSTTSTLLLHHHHDHSLSPFQQILEYELNRNTWHNPTTPTPVMFASVYALPDAASWAVVLRLHVAACDRTTAASLLRELLHNMLMMEQEEGNNKGAGKTSLAMEAMIPWGKAKKAIWARGMDMLAYSLNSLKLTNLKFEDTKSARCSRVVRLQLNKNDTQRLLHGCTEKGIKLCGALTAAGLMAAHDGSRSNSNKYGVVTLIDCRSTLHPSLSLHHFGFYHSVILNSHVMKGGESMWEVAKRTYEAFVKSKKSNKHFSDMADLNLLMRKAMENPAMTSSSSLRTSFMTVFEECVMDSNNGSEDDVGLEDLMGCASVHGVGPSMAVFDTVRDGRLDCVCVYPTPLHSREQMQELVSTMKTILIQAAKNI